MKHRFFPRYNEPESDAHGVRVGYNSSGGAPDLSKYKSQLKVKKFKFRFVLGAAQIRSNKNPIRRWQKDRVLIIWRISLYRPFNTHLVKSRYTTGAASRSFTSTSYDPVTKNEYEYIKVEKNPKKKGYVQLHTTHGDLNIELHCDITPRACENFITLCERGYYNGIAFHRSIRNFMIQGGDPTGTGKGGESIWGKPFKDELNSKLVHSGRGVVSMANSGPNTNGSQFFILYKSATHLNFKHTVFGMMVGGLTALGAMEKVPVDDDDKPLEEIKITSVTVFVNPYTEADEEEEEMAKDEKNAEDDENDKVGSWYSNPGIGNSGSETASGGVGKYLKAKNTQKSAAADTSLQEIVVAKKRKLDVSTGGFKDFSAW